MRITIVGFGSIGQRHARLAKELGHEVSVVTSQKLDNSWSTYANLSAAFTDQPPEAFIVANPTAMHLETVKEIQHNFMNVPILIEKPLGVQSQGFTELKNKNNLWAAYNLRFHPLVAESKKKLTGQKILTAHFYVGQYLPLWRPTQDYRKSYSASINLGGGVLRDLSHELDMMVHLLGAPKRVCALKKHISQLQIETEDCCIILFEMQSGAIATVEMNYLDRIHQRYFTVNCEEFTLRSDLKHGDLTVNESKKQSEIHRDDTYRMQLQDFANERKNLCTFAEGYFVMQLIEAIEKSAAEDRWITL